VELQLPTQEELERLAKLRQDVYDERREWSYQYFKGGFIGSFSIIFPDRVEDKWTIWYEEPYGYWGWKGLTFSEALDGAEKFLRQDPDKIEI